MFINEYCPSGICRGVHVGLVCYFDVIPNVKQQDIMA